MMKVIFISEESEEIFENKLNEALEYVEDAKINYTTTEFNNSNYGQGILHSAIITIK